MFVLTGAGLLAQPISLRRPLVATPVAQTTNAHERASAHKCCHSSSGPRVDVAIPPSPANMPGGNEHACCMRPGPENVAESPSTSGRQRPEVERREAIRLHWDCSRFMSERTTICGRSLLPYDIQNTVLRI